jgi:hypothetical protein
MTSRKCRDKPPREQLPTDEEQARFKELFERDGLTGALAREFNDRAFARGFFRIPGGFRLGQRSRETLAAFIPGGFEGDIALGQIEFHIAVYRRAANRKPDGTRKTEKRLAKNLRVTAQSAAHLCKCLDILGEKDGISLWSLFPGIDAKVIADLPHALQTLAAACAGWAEWEAEGMKLEGSKRPPRDAEGALIENLAPLFFESGGYEGRDKTGRGKHKGRGDTKPCVAFIKAALYAAGVSMGDAAITAHVKAALTRFKKEHS